MLNFFEETLTSDKLHSVSVRQSKNGFIYVCEDNLVASSCRRRDLDVVGQCVGQFRGNRVRNCELDIYFIWDSLNHACSPETTSELRQ